MLRTLENIVGYRLVARDGEIGKVHDFLVDDTLWRLRFLVVETGNWLERRRVLIAPAALATIDAGRREFRVNLLREQVSSSPGIDTDLPVSRQQELLIELHYGWPTAWTHHDVSEGCAGVDPHLRSVREIRTYEVMCGELPAKVQDFVIEDTDWTVMSMVATTGRWLDSRQMSIPAERIMRISWEEQTITAQSEWASSRAEADVRYDATS